MSHVFLLLRFGFEFDGPSLASKRELTSQLIQRSTSSTLLLQQRRRFHRKRGSGKLTNIQDRCVLHVVVDLSTSRRISRSAQSDVTSRGIGVSIKAVHVEDQFPGLFNGTEG